MDLVESRSKARALITTAKPSINDAVSSELNPGSIEGKDQRGGGRDIKAEGGQGWRGGRGQWMGKGPMRTDLKNAGRKPVTLYAN